MNTLYIYIYQLLLRSQTKMYIYVWFPHSLEPRKRALFLNFFIIIIISFLIKFQKKFRCDYAKLIQNLLCFALIFVIFRHQCHLYSQLHPLVASQTFGFRIRVSIGSFTSNNQKPLIVSKSIPASGMMTAPQASHASTEIVNRFV